MSKVRTVPGQAGRLALLTGRLALLIGRLALLIGRLALLIGRLALLIRTAGDRLFQAEDARARQHGWHITARRCGLARTYRDPRFDNLRTCAICRGTGNGLADEPCKRCAGTGRITVVQQPLPERGRGR